ncbi:MAG: hypothetical protein KGH66_01150 [Candidatus Micrarchaeota archaeon]|nr:hypothetical protein [Candidatus Micrarchaeota archaeon]
MKENRCIICGEKRNGLAVKEDYQIRAIRWFKRKVTRNEKGYGLVVCKECYPKYRKQKDSYNKKQGIYLAIGIIFAFFLAAFSGSNIGVAILYGAVVIIFMYALAQLSYMPSLVAEQKKEENRRK